MIDGVGQVEYGLVRRGSDGDIARRSHAAGSAEGKRGAVDVDGIAGVGLADDGNL
jgi:hypothetical protein